MERMIHDLAQGSDEWHQFRLEHFGASEAAAMLGMSSKTTRTELLRMKHTGLAKEFSAWVQEKILDRGHEVEAMARPIVESLIGQDLYPATYSIGKLSASCDGLTMDGDFAFEHKQWNTELAAALDSGTLPDEYMPQCQQVLLVTGAERLIFVCSDGSREKFRYLWVDPDAAWQQRIVAGWTQFNQDLENYQHVEVAATPVAASIDDLPALTVQLVGQVTSSNLAQWQGVVAARIQAINTDLQTDQDFADAEKMVKFLESGEKKLELVKEQSLAQTSSIDELFRAIDSIKGEMRSKRLELDKIVTNRKASIRAEIERRGHDALAEHITTLQDRCEGMMPAVRGDFAGKMKGKRTVASLHDAVDTELARAKIEANEIADRIDGNLRMYAEIAAGYEFLFSDLRNLVNQTKDAFTAMVELRINKHAQAETDRKKREEEIAQAKAATDAAAKIEADRIADAGKVIESAPPPVIHPPHATTTGTGLLRDLIDDELATMTAQQLQQVLDFCRTTIRARRAT